MKKLISKAALLLAAALALPTSANAVVYWDWSWSGTGIYTDTGSGTLTTDDLSGTSYLITAMTGIWNEASITGLLAPGSLGFNNNLLFDDLPQLTFNGVSFGTDAVSSSQVNFYWDGDVNTYKGTASYTILGVFTATQVAAVPEPETYALMLAGLALVGAAARRRKAK